MESITKQTREVGTSAGVLLPRSWLNKQVVVTLFEPSRDKIAKDVIEELFKHDLNEEIKGIYLSNIILSQYISKRIKGIFLFKQPSQATMALLNVSCYWIQGLL